MHRSTEPVTAVRGASAVGIDSRARPDTNRSPGIALVVHTCIVSEKDSTGQNRLIGRKISSWTDDPNFSPPPVPGRERASSILSSTTAMDDEPAEVYSRARPNTTVAQALASRRASANSSFHLAPAGSVPHPSGSVGRSGGGRSTSRTVSFSDELSSNQENGDQDRYEFYDPSWDEDGGFSASSTLSMSGASSTTRQGRFARESSSSSVKWHPVTVEALGGTGSRGNGRGYEGASDGAASVASTETSSTSKKSSGKRLWRRCEYDAAWMKPHNFER